MLIVSAAAMYKSNNEMWIGQATKQHNAKLKSSKVLNEITELAAVA